MDFLARIIIEITALTLFIATVALWAAIAQGLPS
jgi:hypothetical protein